MKEHTGKNKIFIVIIICLCAVIIAGLIYFMKLKGGSDSAFKPDLDPNANPDGRRYRRKADRNPDTWLSDHYDRGRQKRRADEPDESGRKPMLLYI